MSQTEGSEKTKQLVEELAEHFHKVFFQVNKQVLANMKAEGAGAAAEAVEKALEEVKEWSRPDNEMTRNVCFLALSEALQKIAPALRMIGRLKGLEREGGDVGRHVGV